MSSTHRVPICQNFSAKPGDGVQWTDVPPSGCTIEPVTGKPWPFTAGPPITLPSPSNPPATLQKGLKPGPYYFKPTCCSKSVCVTVT
jgi:hypothetical protein